MGEIAWLNGQWMKPAEAMVPAEDRGFLFGDGVYEALVSYAGRLWALERHMRRLARSLREIAIEGVDVARIGLLAGEAVTRSGNSDALIYIQITRGAAPRAHDWKPGMTPTILITARPAPVCPPEYYSAGVAVATQPDLRWGRCDVKSVNLLANVLALHAAKAAGAFEAVLVRDASLAGGDPCVPPVSPRPKNEEGPHIGGPLQSGVVTEGSHSAVFIVKRGALITREEGPHILPSVTQAFVLEMAADFGIPVQRRPFTLKEMLGADEAFVAVTTATVMSVTRVDGRSVGSGKPGEITKRLLAGYRDLIARQDDAPR